ncbi:MAG TPA: POTRA domain-containing protein [Dongiaceae bacterium]|nr:POTRA domain-containing protein [Dongiaceae bacterium]
MLRFGWVVCMGLLLWPRVGAAAPATNAPTAEAAPHFDVREYAVQGGPTLATNTLAAIFSKYTGTNVALPDLVRAASDLEAEYQALGQTNLTVTFAQKKITDGLVTFNVFQSRYPHILVSGISYVYPNDGTMLTTNLTPELLASTTATNAPERAATNAGPRFVVKAYEIKGDTLLSTDTLMAIFAKHTGTNVGVADIVKASSELQMEYRDRGYPTVNVTLPPQQITNGFVKIQVFEGRLASILVEHNRYFSSNNVMRALPSLHTNELLRSPIFQAEVDRANANQDRQIYPQIAPGPVENTSTLILEVKDRLPLHGKVELNNQASPGTPDLRINTSAAYNNLWQHEHSLGVQYSFSPEKLKGGTDWDFYDQPLVANYSGYYRFNLGNPESISQNLASQSGGFGYNEATRRFDLPPPTGRPELTLFASRSTIDTGVNDSNKKTLLNIPGVRNITQQDAQQDITVNEDLGARLTDPLPEMRGWNTSWSLGTDFKSYRLDSYKTNIVVITETTVNENNQPNPPTISTISSSPSTNGPLRKPLEYVPVAVHFDASRSESWGQTTLGLGLSVNAWYSGSANNLQAISGSTNSSGTWVVLTPSFSQDIFIHTNWVMTLRADGQWASEPLISNEQFGGGGVNSVRGYREGEVFGDTGWHVSWEQKTPGHLIGPVFAGKPLIVRGTLFMDYAETYLLDPQGRDSRVPLWGTGFGFVASVGSAWEARFLFSFPLLSTATTVAGQPFFNFALTAQF